MARVAQLIVDIDARTQGLEASMQKTREQLKQVGDTAAQTSQKVDQFANSINSFTRLITRGAIGVAIAETFRQVSQAAEKASQDLQKVANEASQAKLSPENYQVIQIMSERTGRSMSDLIKVVDTGTASFAKFKQTVQGEIIPRQYVEQAKNLEDAHKALADTTYVKLVPGLLELRRTEIIAQQAMVELGEEALEAVTGTTSFSESVKVLSGYVENATVFLVAFGQTLGEIGKLAVDTVNIVKTGVSGITAEGKRAAAAAVGDQQAYLDALKEGQQATDQALQNRKKTSDDLFSDWGKRAEETGKKVHETFTRIAHDVDTAVAKPSVPESASKGADKAARDLKRLQDAIEALGQKQSEITAEYEQAQKRLGVVQGGGGPETLKALEDQQKAEDAYRKTYETIHKAAEAAKLSTEEQNKLAASSANLAKRTVEANTAIAQSSADHQTLQNALEGTWSETEKVNAEMAKLYQAAERANITLTGDQWKKVHDSLSKTKDDMKELSDQIQSSVVGAFEDLGMSLVQGKLDMQEFTRSFLLDIGRIILRLSIMKAITAAMNMFGGGSGYTAPYGSGGFEPLPSAKGNVFEYGNATPFATGGIIGRPTLFPMANGAGLMGEAGPEAVMPLARTSSGELGVKGGGSNVVINIMTPAGTEASTERHQDASGNEQIDVIIQSRMERLMATGRMDNAMRANYGVTRTGRR